ncbi:hypothetical protein [Bacillus sp. OTU530]|uniref:hypothetical protein n=1 Tax=Bacillus sp. OTU530 TaxID=3043862 RepID=UPI00313D2175
MTGSNHIIKDKIHKVYPSFTNSKQKVAQTVLPTGADVIYFSVTELTVLLPSGKQLYYVFAEGSVVQAIRHANYPPLKR